MVAAPDGDPRQSRNDHDSANFDRRLEPPRRTREFTTPAGALFEGLEKCDGFAEVAAAKQELHEVVDKLIRRARRAGAIRRELDSRDIGALVGAAVQASTHAERPDAWKQYIQVVLDGLRP